LAVALVLVAPVARAKKSQQSTKLKVNCPHMAIPKVMYATLLGRVIGDENVSWEDLQDKMGCSNEYHLEVLTQDLPNMQDFGGSLVLVDLDSEQPMSEMWESGDDYDDKEKQSHILNQPTSSCKVFLKWMERTNKCHNS
jgi:hypothetical protein